MNYLSKEYILLFIVILIGVFITSKTFKLPTHGDVEITISEQKGAIATIDTPRKAGSKHEYEIDVISFEQSTVLTHKSLGVLGYSSNFFIDARTQMDVKNSDTYLFYVASDDGFRLWIDDKNICEHVGDRPMETTTCNVKLTKGTHRYRLEYFQGGGPMALKALYKRNSRSKSHLIGDSSDDIVFSKVAS